MSKALIPYDAAYMLGEEAFRAGFKAAASQGSLDVDDHRWPEIEDQAWSEFQPSEDVKDLLDEA